MHSPNPIVLLLFATATLSFCSPTPTGPDGSPGTADAPPASAGHSLVYADHLGQVVLVNAGLGGMTNPAPATPTRVWSWNGSDWALIDSSGPPIRNLAGVTYDARRRVLVMHGGSYDLGRSYGETWEWSGTWRQVTGSGPGVRDHTQMAFDSQRGRAVLFGGSGTDPNVASGETWEYDGSTWTRVSDQGPAGRVHHSMHFDAAAAQVVLFGGNVPGASTLGDTWTWDGSRWTSAGSGPPQSHASLAFHRGLNALVSVGGSRASSGLEMLIRRNGAWLPLSTGAGPSARILTGVAYDERRNVMVLFGGADPSGSTLFGDTWEFDGANWRQISPRASR